MYRLILILTFIPATAMAQDTLELVTGNRFVAYHTRVVDRMVLFSREPGQLTTNTRLPLLRVRKIEFESGATIVYEKHFDQFDPTIDADSAYAQLQGLTKEEYLIRRKRQEQWNCFWSDIGSGLLIPWPF